MTDSFCRVAAITPHIRLGDVDHNIREIISLSAEAAGDGCSVLVFPELCITGYSCGDLFFQDVLIDAALRGLETICRETADLSAVIFVGLPFKNNGKLYNAAAAVSCGKVLGLVPKSNIPNYGEFYEKRYFSKGQDQCVPIKLFGEEIPFGTDQVFKNSYMPDMVIAAEICEDLWVASPPDIRHSAAGADIIVNLSASDELTGKTDYLKSLISARSAQLYSAYIYAGAGAGESTQDSVLAGHRFVYENGRLLSCGKAFSPGITTADVDLGACMARRLHTDTYRVDSRGYTVNDFSVDIRELDLRRIIAKHPFVPDDDRERLDRCEEILSIQAWGLAGRISHIGTRCAVVGISGGLDSTLALIVTVMAFEQLGLDKGGIIGITMPGFGTTDRTYDNACALVKALGATLLEIPIRDSVRQHFKDIGQDENVHDVTYENSQARERTQILMDIANQRNGIVVGTGDLSELALGWATYNGDHMSMYSVNAGVPKTLVRHLVKCYAEYKCKQGSRLSGVLMDVLDTPVSPELLPPSEGQISQKTEELVGPYELHDFFLYYMLRFGYRPRKIFRLACMAFEGEYYKDTVLKWLRVFYRRFFAQQFKRSCLPDGPKVGTVALSPRGDWRMPSDATADLWLAEVKDMV